VRAAKEALSYEGAATVVLPEAARRASVRITRPELERLLEPDVRRSVEILVETVAAAGVGPERLAAVYLAGGASRMPLAGRLLSERFQRVPARARTQRASSPWAPPPAERGRAPRRRRRRRRQSACRGLTQLDLEVPLVIRPISPKKPAGPSSRTCTGSPRPEPRPTRTAPDRIR